jgi:hypothetical protein
MSSEIKEELSNIKSNPSKKRRGLVMEDNARNSLQDIDLKAFAQSSLHDRVTPKHYIGKLMSDVGMVQDKNGDLENDLQLEMFE